MNTRQIEQRKAEVEAHENRVDERAEEIRDQIREQVERLVEDELVNQEQETGLKVTSIESEVIQNRKYKGYEIPDPNEFRNDREGSYIMIKVYVEHKDLQDEAAAQIADEE